MVCHRWTLVIILICILVTVISSFRVRLPGISPDVKLPSKKYKCENCDVNEPNLDQDVNSYKAGISKRLTENVGPKATEDLKSRKKFMNNIIVASDSIHDSKRNGPNLKKNDEKNDKNKKSVFSFNFNEDDSEEIDLDDNDGINLSTFIFEKKKPVSKFEELSYATKSQEVKTQEKASYEDNDEDVDSYDEDEDDEDDDESYDKMIKLVKQRTSEAVKAVSSEDTKHEINDNKIEKLSLYPNPYDHLGKSKSKENLDNTVLKISTKTLQESNTEKIPRKSTKASSEKLPIDKTKQIKEAILDKDIDKSKPIKTTTNDRNTEKVKLLKNDTDVMTKVKLVKKGSESQASEKVKSKVEPIKDISDKSKYEKVITDKDKPKSMPVLKELKDQSKPTPIILEERSQILEAHRKDSQIKLKDNVMYKQKDLKKDKSDEYIKKPDRKENEIQFITEALKRKNLLQSEFEDIYAFLPTFAPNFSRVHNPECRRHGQILLRQLRGTKLWALNMLDATAKIPAGLLQGNGIQLGDFDQCLGTRARVQLETGSIVKIQGKYCLAMLDLKANHPDLEIPVYLAQSKNIFKSRLDDPGHFVPRFSTLSWGVCIPSACDPEDVEVMLRDAVKHYQKKIGISVRFKVDEHDCHIPKGADWWEEWLETPTVITLSFYLIVIVLVTIATIQDCLTRECKEPSDEGEEKDEGEKDQGAGADNKESSGGVLRSFSLYNTASCLIAPAGESDIACIHGMRGVATIALVFAHKFLPVAVTPYTNRLKLSETVSSPWLAWCRAGWMFTDCFLLLSGTLTSYRTSKDDSVVGRLLSKYLRLTPALLAVVLFYAYVWDNISMGPMWGSLVTRNAQICQESWWWNVLYVQNYLGFDNMCAPQTHQLALDLQLTIVGGFVVWAIRSEVPMSWAVMPALHLLSAYSRYTTYRDHRLTALAYQGVSVSQLYRTGSLSYTSTYHRCSPYLIGISLGLILRKPSRIGKFLLTLGWLVCGTLWGLFLWAGADSGDFQYRYDVTFAAQYATLAPIAVSLVFAWVIYTVHNGHFGLLSSILSSRPLLFISRISYALYLIQFLVFLTNSAMVKTSKEFSLFYMFDFQEISIIILASIILTLLFVTPIQSLPRIILSPKTSNVEKDDNDTISIDELEQTQNDTKPETNNVIREEPHKRTRSFMAHREVLEEIPEAEIEYEIRKETNDGLEEIIEEEEEELEEEMIEHIEDEELDVIEEEQGGEDDWVEKSENTPSTSLDDQDVEEWEWTNTNETARETGAQMYRYRR